MAYFLQEIVLEIGKIVLTNDMVTGERSVEFTEYHQHGWRAGPIGHHAISNLRNKKEKRSKSILIDRLDATYFGKAKSSFTSNFVETILILDDIRQR